MLTGVPSEIKRPPGPPPNVPPTNMLKPPPQAPPPRDLQQAFQRPPVTSATPMGFGSPSTYIHVINCQYSALFVVS